MKIIHGRDYYDGAGLGIDETIVFVRKPEEIKVTPFDLPKGTYRLGGQINLRFLLVLLAGEIYPAMIETHPGGFSKRRNRAGEPIYEDSSTEYHYDLKSAQAALKRYKQKGLTRTFAFQSESIENKIIRHFRETKNDDWTKWMVENQISTGTVTLMGDDAWRADYSVCMANISNLKDIEFYRCVDPATAHMRISNWIGGVLPSGPATIEIEDKYRIKKAGFDDGSFRRRKGTTKPRRNKKV
jgi:hypothetical protein